MPNVEDMAETLRKLAGQQDLGRIPFEMLQEDEFAMDDQSAGELDPRLVKEARKSEPILEC